MSTQKSIVYAFIDSQNLNLGVQSQGWKLDFKKFRLYLKNKYGVEKAYLFIGLVPGNERLYSYLSDVGYQLVFKQTVEYTDGLRKTYKGNVDAELVLYAAAKEFGSYDKAVIVSGDGDFSCLIEYLLEHDKLAKMLCPNAHYSSLLRQYSDAIDVVGKARSSLEYKPGHQKDRHRRSVETLGLSGHGDTKIVAKQGRNVNSTGLDRQRWASLSIFEQMGNIGSEVGRALRAKVRGDDELLKGALCRGLDLLDATAEVWAGRMRQSA